MAYRNFLEHMLFKGTNQFKVGEIDRLVEGTGGYLNAGTSHDFTHYYITLASGNFRTALHVLADVIQNSRLETEEMDRERQVILEEYYRKQDDPEGVLWERLYEQVFSHRPLQTAGIGALPKPSPPSSAPRCSTTIAAITAHRTCFSWWSATLIPRR